MESIDWLQDKEKNGERFTNSFCFTYCLKCFQEENRVELWASGSGYKKTYQTLAGALFDYEHIKTLSYHEILLYVERNFEREA